MPHREINIITLTQDGAIPPAPTHGHSFGRGAQIFQQSLLSLRPSSSGSVLSSDEYMHLGLNQRCIC